MYVGHMYDRLSVYKGSKDQNAELVLAEKYNLRKISYKFFWKTISYGRVRGENIMITI